MHPSLSDCTIPLLSEQQANITLVFANKSYES